MKLDIALFALCMHPPTSITAFSPSHHMPTSRKSTHLDTSALESLADLTTLSIDSGDIDTVARYAKTGLITDATTNPLFVSQAGANGDARYEAMVLEAVAYAKAKTCVSDGCAVPEESLNVAIDRLSVNLGKELVNLVPGRVSTEVDIRLSYDKEESAKRGTCSMLLHDMYRLL
jgi:transaldolase